MSQPSESTNGPTEPTTQAVKQLAEKLPESTPAVPAKPKSDESMLRKIFVRFVAGMTMVSIFGLTLQLPHRVFACFIVALQILTWHEVVSVRYNSAKEANLPGFRTMSWYFLFVTLYFYYSKPAASFLVTLNITPTITHYARVVSDNFRLIVFTLYLIAFVGFILSLRGGKILRYQIATLAWIVLCLVLIVGQTSFAISYLLDGYVWIILPHGLIIFNDVMAYFFGLSLGRKFIDRPLTALSPNKTWEGFLGAMISTVIAAYYLAPLFRYSMWLTCPADQYQNGCTVNPVFIPTTYQIPVGWHSLLSDMGVSVPTETTIYPIQIHSVVFALFASLVAPFCGFLASAIKRAFNKKDYDNIIPGHGGFMDRFDCQILMSGFVYIYITTFIRTSSTISANANFAQIANQLNTLGRDDQFRLLQILNEMVNS